jgi:choline dehydrogenase-like flavoprotein
VLGKIYPITYLSISTLCVINVLPTIMPSDFHGYCLIFINIFFRKNYPLSSSPLEACAFTHTQAGLDRPDIQFHFAPVLAPNLHLVKTLPKEEGFTVLPTLLKPKSRGYVGLHDNRPSSAPLIDPCYLSDTKGEDMATLLRAVYQAKDIYYLMLLLLSSARYPIPS